MSEVRDHESGDGWSETVGFVPGPEGFAYRTGEIVVGGDQGRDSAQRMFGASFNADPEPVFPDEDPEANFGVLPANLYVVRGTFDPALAVDELRTEGLVAQPNHVMFTHGCGCWCGPHPALRWQSHLSGQQLYASPLYASPLYASPLYASPLYASPLYASPLYASPLYASDLQATGRRRSSAVPASAPAGARVVAPPSGGPVRVAVLDTGMAADGYRPAALDPMVPAKEHWELPDVDGDDYLDPAAGHGTFIAGLIDLLAPGCELTVEKVLTNYGEGDEVNVARRIHALAGSVDLLNLSFGGYAMERTYVLAAAVRRAAARGTVVVASAGNDGTCRPTYPAALGGVVGVGAVGPHGPAPFTNYGPWVRACAPGVEVVSRFFHGFEGDQVASGGGADPDRFEGWARWSGSSFAAPAVVAALAREMSVSGVDAAEAVRRVVDGPGLFRLPELGTVVNL